MVTVDKALRKGQLIVNIPVFLIMFGVMGLCFFLSIKKLAPYYLAPIGILLGPLAGWIYWSFAITRWRIWAFTNVGNVHELKSRAIASKLIWPDGNIFEKTEIRTTRDKELINELENRFHESNNAKQVIDDPTIPPVTKVFYSKTNLMIESLLMAACLSYGIYLLATDRWILGPLCTILGAYFVIKNFSKITNTQPQLTLDINGISINEQQYVWSETDDITITKSANTWLTFNTDNGPINIAIDDLDISSIELERRLNIYQLRFEKATIANKS